MTTGAGRFARWSERKARARQGETSQVSKEIAEKPEGAATGLAEEPAVDPRELPDPDSLGEGDDFSAFLKKGVPAALKKAALRRLWRTNPALANLDGLLEYGEDFTDKAVVPKLLSTGYVVGKGFRRDPAVEGDAASDRQGPDDPAQEGRATGDLAAEEPAPADGASPSDSAREDCTGDARSAAGSAVGGSSGDEPQTSAFRPLARTASPDSDALGVPVADNGPRSAADDAAPSGPSEDTPAPRPRRMKFSA